MVQEKRKRKSLRDRAKEVALYSLLKYQVYIIILLTIFFVFLTLIRIRYGIATGGKQLNQDYEFGLSPSMLSILLILSVSFLILYFHENAYKMKKIVKSVVLFFLTIALMLSMFYLYPTTDRWHPVFESYYQLSLYTSKNGALDTLREYNTLYNAESLTLNKTSSLAKRFGIYAFYSTYYIPNDHGFERSSMHPPLMTTYLSLFTGFIQSRFAIIIGMVVASAMCIVLFYHLFSMFYPEDQVFSLSLVLMTIPTFIVHTIKPFADVLSLVPILIAAYLFLKKKHLLSGIFLGIAFYIKFTAAFAAIPLIVILLLDRKFFSILLLALGSCGVLLVFELLGYHFILTFMSMLVAQKDYFTGIISQNLLLFYLINPLGTLFNFGIIFWVLFAGGLLRGKRDTIVYGASILFFYVMFLNGQLGRYLITLFIFFLLVMLDNLKIDRKFVEMGIISNLVLAICFIII
jgi:hypothetical protein